MKFLVTDTSIIDGRGEITTTTIKTRHNQTRSKRPSYSYWQNKIVFRMDVVHSMFHFLNWFLFYWNHHRSKCLKRSSIALYILTLGLVWFWDWDCETFVGLFFFVFFLCDGWDHERETTSTTREEEVKPKMKKYNRK